MKLSSLGGMSREHEMCSICTDEEVSSLGDVSGIDTVSTACPT